MSYGMPEIVKLNSHVWCSLDNVVNVVCVNHTENIQHSYNQFGGNGVPNYYVVCQQIMYTGEGDDIELTRTSLHHSNFFAFSHQHQHTSGYHYYNIELITNCID